MIDSRRRRAEYLFQQAADLEPHLRQPFLHRECGKDDSLVREVAFLLERYENGTVTSLSEVERLDATETDLVGKCIGPYKLLQLIGEGGFGAVYMAEQEKPVRRKVALKILKLGMDTRQVIARFEAERQALALMEHPNIARVYDAGATDTGRPYFVMELVRGIPITEYCDESSLSTRDRMELFIQVCKAVQHAHQKGVIHRDLKPSNVLVTLHDGTPVPKVIDFGIAKATGERLTDKTLFTEFLQFIGTPQYMSPEQAAMSGLDVDTRTDLYSLGVLLYELLTGTTPFEAATLRRAAFGEIQRIIREEDPPTPSKRISTLGARAAEVARSRGMEPPALRKAIRGDLDWIVMKALEKDRTRRYQTAVALAEDVERHLHHEPVLAGPPGGAYRLLKFVRRNRAAVITGATISAAILIGFLMATVGFVRARAEAESTREINAFFNEMLVSVDPMQLRLLSAYRAEPPIAPRRAGGIARDVSVAEMVRLGGQRIDSAFAGKPELAATAYETIGMTMRGLGLYAEAEPYLQGAWDTRASALGTEHPDTLRAALALGELLVEMGCAAQGYPRVLEARDGYERIFGPRDSRTLSATSILASVLADSDKFAEAEKLFSATLESQREVLGREHRDTLATMWKWSVACLQRGQHDRGRALAHELDEIVQRTLGPEDSLSILSKPLMGWWHIWRCEYDQAERIVKPGLEQSQRILGEDHPFTCMNMQCLARALQGADNQDEKERLYRKALAGMRLARGSLHWQTLSALHDFAGCLAERGKTDEAEKLYRELVDGAVQSYGERSKYALEYMSVLAGFLERIGKFDESLAILRKQLANVAKIEGAGSISVQVWLDRLAQACLRMGRVEEARRTARELIELLRTNMELADDKERAVAYNQYAWMLLTLHPADMRNPRAALPIAEKAVEFSEGRSSPILDTLALAYHLTGDNDRAVITQIKSIELLPASMQTDLLYNASLIRYLLKKGEVAAVDQLIMKSVDQLRDALGKDHPLLPRHFAKQAAELANYGHFILAEALYRESHAMNLNIFGAEHEQTADSLEGLAQILARQGKYEPAAKLYRRVSDIRASLLGCQHVKTADSLSALGAAEFGIGNFDEAATAFVAALEIFDRLGANDVPAVWRIRTQLARALIMRGKHDEAAALIHESLERTRALYGEFHPETVAAMETQGLLLCEIGELARAESLLRRAMELSDAVHASESERWQVTPVKISLGFALTRDGCYEEAETLLLDGYAAICRVKGDQYLETRTAAKRLAELYDAWGKSASAESWRAKAAVSASPTP